MALYESTTTSNDSMVGTIEVDAGVGIVRAFGVVVKLTPRCLGSRKPKDGHKGAENAGELHDVKWERDLM